MQHHTVCKSLAVGVVLAGTHVPRTALSRVLRSELNS